MTLTSLKVRRQNLKTLVDDYTRSFPEFEQTGTDVASSINDKVVLLSGSTGAFGSNILAALVSCPNVRLVYAVSRPSRAIPDVYERHANAFRREGIDAAILEDDRVKLIEGDLSENGFGLTTEIFQVLKSSVTHIVHNGWQVNLNLPISRFEPNIRSIRNLVDFSLTSKARSDRPAKLIFISSLAIFCDTDPSDPDEVRPEERLLEPDCALGLGYTEAKWVSESILDQAAGRTALRPTIVRLGQLAGGPSGYWSEREYFAAIVKSSLLFGMLPNVPGVLSWNRSHIAAQALVDMLDTEERYVHLVHPKPIAWTTLISIFGRRLRLPVVHIDDWMAALHRAISQAELASSELGDATASRESMRQAFRQNPAARMLNFFLQEHESCKGKPLSPDQQTFLTQSVHCEKAIAASRTLRDPELPQIGEADVEQWLAN